MSKRSKKNSVEVPNYPHSISYMPIYSQMTKASLSLVVPCRSLYLHYRSEECHAYTYSAGPLWTRYYCPLSQMELRVVKGLAWGHTRNPRPRTETQTYLTLTLSRIKSFIGQKANFQAAWKQRFSLSRKKNIRYFLVYTGERKRAVIKLGALGFGRERTPGRIGEGEAAEILTANLAHLLLPGFSGSQSNSSSCH